MTGPFELSLKTFADKAMGHADATVRRTVINFADRLIERSPVGLPATWKRPAPAGYRPGQFRANWQISLSGAPEGTISAVDPSGSVTRSKIAAAIPQKAADKTFYLANNLEYGPSLEYGHHSNQAPFGMVGVTVLEFNLLVSQAAAEAANGPTELLLAAE